MKKFAAICLALLMLTLPVLGCAATSGEMISNARDKGMPLKTTVTFTPADLSSTLGAETAAVYSDVLNALSIELYQADDQGSLSAQLSGKDVLSLTGAIKDGTTYLNSNFLGSRSIAVDADEWQPLLEKLVDLLAAAGEMDEDEAALVKAQLAGMFSGEMAVQMNAEDAFADVDWTPVIDLVSGMLKKKGTVAEVTEQPADCDKAMNKVTVTLDGEDMVKLYSTAADCIRKSDSAMAFLDKQLESAEMTAEELFTEFIDAMEEACTEMTMELLVTEYMSLSGDLVAMDMDMTMTQDDVTVKIPLVYRRLTGEQGVSHTVSIRCSADDVPVMTVDLLYLDADPAGMVTFKANLLDGDDKMQMTADAAFDDKNVDASFKMDVTEDGESVVMTVSVLSTNEDNKSNTDVKLNVNSGDEDVSIALKLDGEQTPGDTTASSMGNMSLSMDVDGVEMALNGSYTAKAETGADGVCRETNADVGLTVMGMEIPLCSVKAVTENCDAMASLAEGASVHPAAMSDEELSAYGEEIVTDAQTALMVLIQNLPTSVLQLMMGN
ncbi:MAG: hypothetical protein SOY30_07060 [Eubacteriales bacterium]|nr:hypothetical protein [Eubacteriales bacterium]